MNARQVLKWVAFFVFVFCWIPQPAQAYVGPGTGMSAVGVFMAIVMGIVVAIFGFIWYPLKRLLRTRRRPNAVGKGEQQA
jgi:hypothetical protein